MKIIIIILLTVLLSCQSAVPPPVKVDSIPIDNTEVIKVDKATEIWLTIIWVGMSMALSVSLYDYQQVVLK